MSDAADDFSDCSCDPCDLDPPDANSGDNGQTKSVMAGKTFPQFTSFTEPCSTTHYLTRTTVYNNTMAVDGGHCSLTVTFVETYSALFGDLKSASVTSSDGGLDSTYSITDDGVVTATGYFYDDSWSGTLSDCETAWIDAYVSGFSYDCTTATYTKTEYNVSAATDPSDPAISATLSISLTDDYTLTSCLGDLDDLLLAGDLGALAFGFAVYITYCRTGTTPTGSDWVIGNMYFADYRSFAGIVTGGGDPVACVEGTFTASTEYTGGNPCEPYAGGATCYNIGYVASMRSACLLEPGVIGNPIQNAIKYRLQSNVDGSFPVAPEAGTCQSGWTSPTYPEIITIGFTEGAPFGDKYLFPGNTDCG